MGYTLEKPVRGRKLEQWFERVAPTIPGIFYQRLNPGRQHNGKYIRKAPADYLILTNNNIWLIDTKETKKDYWKLSSTQLHQYQNMLRFIQTSPFAKAGFVVWFYECDPARSNLRFFDTSLASGKCNYNDGVKFSWEMFL